MNNMLHHAYEKKIQVQLCMSQVRPVLPTPDKGDLPLPKDGLPRLASAFDPQSVEDLNAVVPENAPKLQTAHPPQVIVCLSTLLLCELWVGAV